MAYSLAFFQAVSILVFIATKMKMSAFEYLSTKVIASKLNMAVPTVTKVIKNLSKAQLIITKEGLKGGILLAKEPDTISLLDIFHAVENKGPIFKINFNFNIDSKMVSFFKQNIINSFSQAEIAMKNVLATKSVADLMHE